MAAVAGRNPRVTVVGVGVPITQQTPRPVKPVRLVVYIPYVMVCDTVVIVTLVAPSGMEIDVGVANVPVALVVVPRSCCPLTVAVANPVNWKVELRRHTKRVWPSYSQNIPF
jgi:hypothetical protein